MATKDALGFTIHPHDMLQSVALTVTLLATGVFLGLTVAGRVALYHWPMVEPRPWVHTIETMRWTTVGLAVGGFSLLLYLDSIDT